MGLIGGMMAGGLGQAAGNAVDIATQQIDLNNKQQFASFQSGLEADRQAQALRLQQTIGRENTAFAASPTGLAQSSAVEASGIRTKALTAAEPDVLAATQKVDAAKPIQVGPMHTVVQQQDDGSFKGVYTNPNSPYLDRTKGQTARFTAKEIDDGLSAVNGFVEKAYGATDPVTQKSSTPAALTNIGATEYMAEINAGAQPAQARATAQNRVTNAYESAQAVLNDPRYADQVKANGGGLSGALRVATALKQPAPAAKTGGAAATPAPPPPTPGVINAARGASPQPIVGGARDPEDLRDVDADAPRTQADEDAANAGRLTDDQAAKAARDKMTAAERERLTRRGSSSTGL